MLNKNNRIKIVLISIIFLNIFIYCCSNVPTKLDSMSKNKGKQEKKEDFEKEIEEDLLSKSNNRLILQDNYKEEKKVKYTKSFISSLFEIFHNKVFLNIFLWSLLVSLVCSYIGVFIILRRTIFFGLTIGQASACGVAFGLLLGISSEIMAIIFAISFILIITLIDKNGIGYKEIALGIFYLLFTSASTLFISKNPSGESHLVQAFFGDLLSIEVKNPTVFLIISVIALIIHLLLFKYFISISLDYTNAKIQRLPVKLITFVYNVSIGITIAVSIQLTGALYTLSNLIIPAYVSILFAKSIKSTIISSLILSTVLTFLGFWFSIYLDIPTSATIISVSCIISLILVIFYNDKIEFS